LDLKLENIVFDAEFNPIIIDFGHSRNFIETVKYVDFYVGTQLYWGPEMHEKKPYFA
jgi:serine/threonine protein kinase